MEYLGSDRRCRNPAILRPGQSLQEPGPEHNLLAFSATSGRSLPWITWALRSPIGTDHGSGFFHFY